MIPLTLVCLVLTSLVVSLMMYFVPFPNTLLDPDFRWDGGAGGVGGDLSEFGKKILRFQVVLAPTASSEDCGGRLVERTTV